MSDPVTNVEIEDVLSSIRRLVSSEPQEGDAPAGKDASNHEQPANDGHDTAQDRPAQPKLVLTPAQRVNDAGPQEVDAPEAVSAEEIAEPEPSDEIEAEAATEDTSDVAEDEATEEIADGDGDDAPHAAEDALLQMVADQVATHAEEGAAEELDAQLSDHLGDTQDDASEEDSLETAADADTGMAEDAEIDAQLDTQTDSLSVEDATPEDVDLDMMDDQDVPEFLRRPLTQMNPPEDADVISDTPPEAEGDAPSEVETSFTAKLETLEAAVAEQAEDWEPDGGEAETLSGDGMRPLPWTEIEAETAEMTAQEAGEDPYAEAEQARAEEAQAEEAQSPPWFGEDAVLDEDALRDMVGEIVRQELQGALGERITRNVRKLVRREINRALMSQGLD
ncbi:MAG: hypothetical protein AAGL23_12220 [Pseudomonadota bacterium]